MEVEEGKCWQPGGSGPRPPREVNPRVGPELDAVIRRMLSLKPEERGTAKELAEVMERGVEHARPEVSEGLFEWETLKRTEWPSEDMADTEELGHRARRRNSDVVRVAVEADAAKRAEAKRQQTEVFTRAAARVERDLPQEWGLSLLVLLMPKPLPGQLKPDANGRCRKGQYVINGGCWLKVEVSATRPSFRLRASRPLPP